MTTTLDLPEDMSPGAEDLHAMDSSTCAAVVVCLSDSLVGWFHSSGHTIGSWLMWLCSDAAHEPAEGKLHRPRVFPLVLRVADLSKDQSDKAAEFVPGRGWLRLHPLAETEHANPAYPALPALHAADSATATGGASAADHDEDREPNRKAAFDFGVDRLVLALRVRILKQPMRLPSRFVFLSCSPTQHALADALKVELKERLGIHALRTTDLFLCGDHPSLHLKHAARKAYAVLACLCDASLLDDSLRTSPETVKEWAEARAAAAVAADAGTKVALQAAMHASAGTAAGERQKPVESWEGAALGAANSSPSVAWDSSHWDELSTMRE